jgi:hypothetical protein
MAARMFYRWKKICPNNQSSVIVHYTANMKSASGSRILADGHEFKMLHHAYKVFTKLF